MKKSVAAAMACLLMFCLPAPSLAAGAEVPDGFIPVWNREDLEAMAAAPGESYILMADIDMGGALWQPVMFSGVLDGGGHTLYNLEITQPDGETAVSVDGNRIGYDTVFAAFFSRTYGAVIQNLHLLNAEVAVTTAQSCYAAALVGYAENTQITGCSVQGRVFLQTEGKMCGVSGIAGFGSGAVSGSSADVTLVLVDANDRENCEEFLGGALASGYMDLDGCDVTVRGYTSVHGYVHNGGLVGMYYVHTSDTGHQGYIRNCSVDAVLTFFEDVASRRAYSAPVIGEQMHWVLALENNTTRHFESVESFDYATPLLPERCESPAYTEAVTPPGCDSFGYTTRTCTGCGYSYTDDYLAPAHSPGEWTAAAPAGGESALEVQHCLLCGALLAEREPAVPQACVPRQTHLRLAYKDTAVLQADVQPESAAGAGVVYTSSADEVAAVDQSGTVTATGRGRATITCAAAADISVYGSCEVEVYYTFRQWLIVIFLFGWLWY